MEDKKIGERIKSRRIELDMTQNPLGDMVGVSGSTISRWERGIIGDLGCSRLIKLSAALRTSPDHLLGLTDDPSIQGLRGLESDLADLNDEELDSLRNYILFLKRSRISWETAAVTRLKAENEALREENKLHEQKIAQMRMLLGDDPQ